MVYDKTTMNSSTAVRGILSNSRMARKTQQVYDALAPVYPVSSYLFHADAHRAALRQSEVRNGMDILEVATGSGELFRKLVELNSAGRTVGIDLSHQMAARSQRMARKHFPTSVSACYTASGCRLPLADHSFDRIFSCLMLELLDAPARRLALMEFRRVLRPGGRATLVLIGEDSRVFNWLFRRATRTIPAFWGPQTEDAVLSMFDEIGFRIVASQRLRQNGYPSFILTIE